MLIVTEHHRDAKEGKYGAGDSLKCKSEPTDHHMLNGSKTFSFCWVSQQHTHTWIHTYYKTPLISVSLTHFEGKAEIPGDTGLTEHSASAVEEIYSQKRLCSYFDTAEDAQFASVNLKIRTPEGRDWAGDGMSPEPHWVRCGAGRNHRMTPRLREWLRAAPGQRSWMTPNLTLCDCWCPRRRPWRGLSQRNTRSNMHAAQRDSWASLEGGAEGGVV